MRNRTIILILSICINNLVYSQDFSFTWKISPSLAGRYYTVRVIQNDSKREIQLRETISKQFRTKKLIKKIVIAYSHFYVIMIFLIKVAIQLQVRNLENILIPGGCLTAIGLFFKMTL